MVERQSDRRVQQLATTVEKDIGSRKLRVGDRYLTTVEVATLLGVSTRIANEAMQLLATRHVVIRRPKAGTVVGPGFKDEMDGAEAGPFDVLHLLIRNDYYLAEQRRMAALIAGVTSELPTCPIRLDFVPAFNELSHVQALLRSSTDGDAKVAVLIAVKSPQLQRFFSENKIPAVLLGTPFQGIFDLPWVDKDQQAIGRLLAKRLIEAGHQRIGVVLRDRRGYGDDLLADAITDEVIAAGLGSGGMIIRSVPAELPLIALSIDAMLAAHGRPTALVCRNRLIAQVAARVAAERGLVVGQDLALALCDAPADAQDVFPLPCLRPTIDTDATAEGAMVARMLVAVAGDASARKKHHVIPIRLV